VCYSGKRFNLGLLRALELRGMLDVAETITMGAIRRTESRGGHFRIDHQERDDANWLHHTMAFCTDEGPDLRKKDVTITMFEPEARRY
jgi:succinate dehydrogenase / fumarate reductase, flavoprotein subunit